MAYKYYVILLPTIFILKNVKVYIDISNSYNKAFYIKTLINDLFNKQVILWISNINSYNCYIRFKRNFANTRFKSNFYVIKDISSYLKS